MKVLFQILISKYSNEDDPENKIHFMEVQSGDASEVVSHSSKVHITYAAHVVDGAKVGKKFDSNKDAAGAKLLAVDLTAKKGGSVVTVSLKYTEKSFVLKLLTKMKVMYGGFVKI